MGLSFWHIMIVLLVFVLLFGRGKISDLMGDVAKGIKSFKKGLSEDDEQPIDVQRRLNAEKDKADTPR
jgi:sec-independent protein translocase protein TatA